MRIRQNKNGGKWVVVLLAAAILLVLYYVYNPSEHEAFLQCPFKKVTGYDCPGCGSQRGLHSLLHGHFLEAWHHNALFVLAVPYVLLGLIFNIKPLKSRYPQLAKFFYDWRTILGLVVLAVLYGVVRNL